MMTAPIIGFILVTVFVFGGALFPAADFMIYGDDIHRSYYFFREFFNHWIRQGVFPWWNPYIFGGQPFIADPIVNIWYPINWLFIFIPLNIAYAWHIALHVVWAMTGMYTLTNAICYAQLADNKKKFQPQLFGIAAWVSGVVFGLSGFFAARTWSGHVDVIAAASWMPWVVWAIDRAMTTGNKKHIAQAAGIFALQLLSGYQTMAFMTVIAVGFVAVFRSIAVKRWTPIRLSLQTGVIGIGLAAFHLIPVAEFFRASIRTFHLPYSWASYGAWGFQSLIQMLNPFFFGDQYTYRGPAPNFGEHSAFVGVIGLLLAMIGVITSVKHKLFMAGTAFVALAVFGVWISLGPNAPLDIQRMMWEILPMYRYVRIPARHLILVVFSLSFLCGAGLVYVLTAAKKWHQWIGVVIAGLVVIEMMVFSRHFIELRQVPERRHDRELVERLTQDSQPYRTIQNFGVWLPARDVLDFDSTMSYGIYSATGYSPSILRPYFEYISRSVGQSGEQAMLSHDVQVPYMSAANAGVIDFLNIKYIIVPPEHDPFADNARYQLVWDDDRNKYRLYENTSVLPRYFLSDQSCGTVEVSSYTPNKVVLAVSSTCAATIRSSEVWYPGWTATIDGKRTSIDKENGVFRTLFISPGKHVIVYEFRPTIFLFGGIISVLTGIFLLRWLKKPTTDADLSSIG